MPMMSSWDPNKPLQVLIYGKFKLGKTWGALTFPRPNVISFDRGTAVARNPEWIKAHGLDQYNAIRYEEFYETKKNNAGVVTAHTAFDNACRYFDEWMKPVGRWPGFDKVGRDEFDTWVIDSGTTLSEVALNKAIILLGGKQLGIASKTHNQALTTGLVYPKMQDYGSERSMVEQFIDMVKDSGKNVVFICHEKEITDDEGNLISIVPLLTGKGVESVSLKFDEVYRLLVKKTGTENRRQLQTVPTTIVKCGSRLGVPDGTAWNYAALQAELKKVNEQFTQLGAK